MLDRISNRLVRRVQRLAGSAKGKLAAEVVAASAAFRRDFHVNNSLRVCPESQLSGGTGTFHCGLDIRMAGPFVRRSGGVERHCLLRPAHPHITRSRNGALFYVPQVECRGYSSIFWALTHTNGNHWCLYLDTLSHLSKTCLVRYWDFGADTGLSGLASFSSRRDVEIPIPPRVAREPRVLFRCADTILEYWKESAFRGLRRPTLFFIQWRWRLGQDCSPPPST